MNRLPESTQGCLPLPLVVANTSTPPVLPPYVEENSSDSYGLEPDGKHRQAYLALGSVYTWVPCHLTIPSLPEGERDT
jgi:hypothetical protein